MRVGRTSGRRRLRRPAGRVRVGPVRPVQQKRRGGGLRGDARRRARESAAAVAEERQIRRNGAALQQTRLGRAGDERRAVGGRGLRDGRAPLRKSDGGGRSDHRHRRRVAERLESDSRPREQAPQRRAGRQGAAVRVDVRMARRGPGRRRESGVGRRRGGPEAAGDRLGPGRPCVERDGYGQTRGGLRPVRVVPEVLRRRNPELGARQDVFSRVDRAVLPPRGRARVVPLAAKNERRRARLDEEGFRRDDGRDAAGGNATVPSSQDAFFRARP